MRIAVSARSWDRQCEKWGGESRFISVWASGETAENAVKNFTLGQRVLVEGRVDRYEQEIEEEVWHEFIEIRARRLHFLPWSKADREAEEFRKQYFEGRR